MNVIANFGEARNEAWSKLPTRLKLARLVSNYLGTDPSSLRLLRYSSGRELINLNYNCIYSTFRDTCVLVGTLRFLCRLCHIIGIKNRAPPTRRFLTPTNLYSRSTRASQSQPARIYNYGSFVLQFWNSALPSVLCLCNILPGKCVASRNSSLCRDCGGSLGHCDHPA